ncbi:mechanosensitive ion channel [soil metagenome]
MQSGAMEDLDRYGLILFRIGSTPVTVVSLTVALVVGIGGIVLARLIGRYLRRLRARTTSASPVIYVFERLAVYGLVIASLIAGFTILGVNLSSVAVFAGALGVGVGLGLQGIVKEFVSGLVLIFEGSVRVGDYIELVGGARGEVKEVGPRATRIRNNDRLDILVPNSRLIEERVTNWTHKGGSRRIHVPFYVPYGTDKAMVRDSVLEAARKVPFTLPDEGDRKSQVWLVSFGENAMNFELLVWPELAAVKRPNAAFAAYTWAIDDALRQIGVQTPMRQVDLHVKSVFDREGDTALKALGLKTGPAGDRPTQAVSDGSNDAVADLEAARERDIAKAATSPPPPPEDDLQS